MNTEEQKEPSLQDIKNAKDFIWERLDPFWKEMIILWVTTSKETGSIISDIELSHQCNGLSEVMKVPSVI